MRWSLTVLVVLFAGGTALPDDPQPATKTADTGSKPKADGKPRPTTVEEFAALAKDGPLPPWQSFTSQLAVKVSKVYGTVVEVSADSIEVRPRGGKETVKYPPHVLLATGAVCHWETDSRCYLLDDVQKGDEVMLGVGTADEKKGDECFFLSIQRRPGGVIPASRKPSEPKPYHLRRQRELDYEAKGENTPEDIKDDIEKRKLHAEKGLPPPPPLQPPVKPMDDPKKKD